MPEIRRAVPAPKGPDVAAMLWAMNPAARSHVPLVATLVALLLGGCAMPSEPGTPVATALACGVLPNCISSVDGGAPPLSFEGDAARAQARLRRTLAQFPEARIVHNDASGLDVIFTTRVGFEDEVAFRVDAARQRIDYRSRSRLGLFDFGKNRSRMREFAERFAASGA